MTKAKNEADDWVLNDKNFIKLWRNVMDNKSAINTLFYEMDKLKKKIQSD